MGYKCRFIDNEEYSAKDVSDTFSLLISNGVLAYPQDANPIEAIAGLTSEVVSEGVADYNGLFVTVSDGMINVGEGSAFFASGVSITVDEEGVSVPRGDEAEIYVAWVYDEEYNSITLYHEPQMPSGDYVLLAKITDNTVHDMRTFATAKAFNNTANVYQELTVTMQKMKGGNTFNNEYVARCPLLNKGFRYIIVKKFLLQGTSKKITDVWVDIGNNEITDIHLISDYYLKVKREPEHISMSVWERNYIDSNTQTTCELLLL